MDCMHTENRQNDAKTVNYTKKKDCCEFLTFFQALKMRCYCKVYSVVEAVIVANIIIIIFVSLPVSVLLLLFISLFVSVFIFVHSSINLLQQGSKRFSDSCIKQIFGLMIMTPITLRVDNIFKVKW